MPDSEADLTLGTVAMRRKREKTDRLIACQENTMVYTVQVEALLNFSIEAVCEEEAFIDFQSHICDASIRSLGETS